MSLLLDSARLEIQNASRRAIATVLLRAQLVPHLLQVVRVHKVEQTPVRPLAGRVPQHRLHRVAHVDDVARVTLRHEQEAVGRLQYQVLQLLVGEEGGLVGAVAGQRVAVVAAQTAHVRAGHAQNRQFVGLGILNLESIIVYFKLFSL